MLFLWFNTFVVRTCEFLSTELWEPLQSHHTRACALWHGSYRVFQSWYSEHRNSIPEMNAGSDCHKDWKEGNKLPALSLLIEAARYGVLGWLSCYSVSVICRCTKIESTTQFLAWSLTLDYRMELDCVQVDWSNRDCPRAAKPDLMWPELRLNYLELRKTNLSCATSLKACVTTSSDLFQHQNGVTAIVESCCVRSKNTNHFDSLIVQPIWADDSDCGQWLHMHLSNEKDEPSHRLCGLDEPFFVFRSMGESWQQVSNFEKRCVPVGSD